MSSRFVEVKDWDTAYKYSQAGLLVNDAGGFGSFWVSQDVWENSRIGRYGVLVEDDDDESQSA